MIRTWTDWDWDGADQAWRRALALDSKAADTHAYFAHLLAITGRTGEAISHSERAIELDPFNALFHALHAMVLYLDRRYDDAIDTARTALAMQPRQRGGVGGALLGAFFCKGMHNEYLAFVRERIARDPERVAAFEQGLVEDGYEGAMRRLAELLAARYEESGSRPFGIARGYLGAGDHDRAIEWFEKAYGDRDPNMPYLGQPQHDPLRSDPRFQDLLSRMNLPVSKVEQP